MFTTPNPQPHIPATLCICHVFLHHTVRIIQFVHPLFQNQTVTWQISCTALCCFCWLHVQLVRITSLRARPRRPHCVWRRTKCVTGCPPVLTVQTRPTAVSLSTLSLSLSPFSQLLPPHVTINNCQPCHSHCRPCRSHCHSCHGHRHPCHN